MTLLWPWSLAGLLAVAAVAAWALRRPVHQVALVGSLSLWTKALEALGPSSARRARRINLAWLLLLSGATVAAVGLSRPVYYAQRPARCVAVAIYPGAELADGPADVIPKAVLPLLDRLDGHDRVQLLLPTELGGAGDVVSVWQARQAVGAIRPLPVPSGLLDVPPFGPSASSGLRAALKSATGGPEPVEGPPPDAQVRHTYRFAPATLALPEGPDVTVIRLPTAREDVTLDAFAAETVAGGGTTGQAGQSVELFVALRNHSRRPMTGQALVGRGGDTPVAYKYDIPPGGRTGLTAQLPADGEFYWVAVAGSSSPSGRAYLATRSAALVRVAMLGADDPLVRRLLQIHPGVRIVADPASADAVVAIRAEPPPGLPALVIDPPRPPAGWSTAGAACSLLLRDAAVLASQPPMLHVDLSTVWVSRATPWRPSGAALGGAPCVALDGQALILTEQNPRRLWLAFDTSTENTNLALTDAFVILLANSLEFLAPGARTQTRYESLSALEAGPQPDWRRLPAAADAPDPDRGGPLPWPGVYRDGAGGLHAVNLVGLRSSPAGASSAPAGAPAPAEGYEDLRRQVASAALAEPTPISAAVELWPFLAALAGALWLAGWTARLK